MSDVIRIAQELLKDRGFYAGPIDGLAGKKTHDAAVAAIGKKYGLIPDKQRAEEYAIMFVQDYALTLGLDSGPVDGWYGQKTADAVKHICRTIAQPVPARKPGTILSEQDFAEASRNAGIELAMVKAITSVESRGRGFLPTGDPIILFEGHVFWSQLEKVGKSPQKISLTLPQGILYPKWVSSFYVGGAGEWQRLGIAAEVDQGAAMQSASWGLLQVMGFHFKACGYASIHAFVEAMRQSEKNQLVAALRLMATIPGMLAAIKAHDFKGIALRWNGAGYAKHGYHTRLEQAYRKYS
ncbi:N-acetylmuramidase domain-containing protein [Chlorobium sp.]|uniref:N-acetylmuramidase domain-containing protein n=1 Tax=Chlorobium sp. TaxID=1095 RepID=UPI003C55018C